MRMHRIISALVVSIFAGPAFAATCNIYDMASLQNCVAQGLAVDTYSFQSDVACWGTDCCTMLNVSHRSGVTIQGNGRLIARRSQQKVCPAILVNYSSNVSINSLQIDEDEAAARCLGDEACPGTIEIRNSENVTLESVGVYHAKKVGVGANDTDGFVLNNSTISNAGVLGVFVGDQAESGKPARNISVKNSVISHTGVNGVTFWNVTAPSGGGDNYITNNIIDNNHYVGGYYTPTFSPYFNNGGQLFIKAAQWTYVANNLIANGGCDSCRGFSPLGGHYSGIPAIEVGPGTLSYTRFHANRVRNSNGPFIFANSASVDFTNAIWENDSRGMSLDYHVRGGSWFPQTGPNGFGNYTPSAAMSGKLHAAIYRLYSAGFHQEANFRTQHGNSVHETTFGLSSYPLPRGPSRPIYRCLIWHTGSNDFPSLDQNCESPSFFLHSILGYSYPAGHPGAQPFYRCLVRSSSTDHFLSWDPNCEGQNFIQTLGYAIPR
jgi:hypothetical protein